MILSQIIQGLHYFVLKARIKDFLIASRTLDINFSLKRVIIYLYTLKYGLLPTILHAFGINGSTLSAAHSQYDLLLDLICFGLHLLAEFFGLYLGHVLQFVSHTPSLVISHDIILLKIYSKPELLKY